MNTLFTPTGGDLPLSPVFIEFLGRWVDPAGIAEETWHNQLSEELSGAPQRARQRATLQLRALADHPTARAAIERAYAWFRELVDSNLGALQQLQQRCQFIPVIGVPRSGGSYLVAELFSALGYDPTTVPAALAHDGFPEAGPTVFMPRHNGWMRTLLSTGEYLAMVELFFQRTHNDRVVVPKKLTKGIYASGFFKQILGQDTEFIVTVRHPLACCISTYEKSGGLPPGGISAERSTIEHWIKRDLMSTGVSSGELAGMDYFSAYVRYWEQYYSSLAMSGLMRHARTTTIVDFEAERMRTLAMRWHSRYASGKAPAEFLTRAGLRERHPQWIRQSVESIERVANLWQRMGIPFPAEQISSCL